MILVVLLLLAIDNGIATPASYQYVKLYQDPTKNIMPPPLPLAAATNEGNFESFPPTNGMIYRPSARPETPKVTTYRPPKPVYRPATVSPSALEYDINFWVDDKINDFLEPKPLSFETHHVTPDYSNGLAYPDPVLLTGGQANRAAWILYRNPLYFSQIDHSTLLGRNQVLRNQNGLAGNKLGSLRPGWPSYRYKEEGHPFRILC